MVVMSEFLEIGVFFSIIDKLQGIHSILQTSLYHPKSNAGEMHPVAEKIFKYKLKNF